MNRLFKGMLSHIRRSTRAFLIGGLSVILPLAILSWFFHWIFTVVKNSVEPITALIVEKTAMQDMAAFVIALIIIVAASIAIGIFIQTKVGKFLHEELEDVFLKRVPFYTTVRQVIVQVLGDEKMLFRGVAVCAPFGERSGLMTAFITDRHDDGSYTVFVPTSPNPTSGYTFHLSKDQCAELEAISVEEGMRSILACGAGSGRILSEWNKRTVRDNGRDSANS